MQHIRSLLMWKVLIKLAEIKGVKPNTNGSYWEVCENLFVIMHKKSSYPTNSGQENKK